MSRRYEVERHDEDDGSITYEVWDHDPASYRMICSISERDYIAKAGDKGSAIGDAKMVARALEAMAQLERIYVKRGLVTHSTLYRVGDVVRRREFAVFMVVPKTATIADAKAYIEDAVCTWPSHTISLDEWLCIRYLEDEWDWALADRPSEWESVF